MVMCQTQEALQGESQGIYSHYLERLTGEGEIDLGLQTRLRREVMPTSLQSIAPWAPGSRSSKFQPRLGEVGCRARIIKVVLSTEKMFLEFLSNNPMFRLPTTDDGELDVEAIYDDPALLSQGATYNRYEWWKYPGQKRTRQFVKDVCKSFSTGIQKMARHNGPTMEPYRRDKDFEGIENRYDNEGFISTENLEVWLNPRANHRARRSRRSNGIWKPNNGRYDDSYVSTLR